MQAIVEIRKPCHETLEKRKAGEQGNYCKSCQTLVIDFTALSAEEIAAYFINHKQDYTCGTFVRGHVKTDNKLDNFISYLHSGKLKFLAVVLIGILIVTGCRTRKTTTYHTTGRVLDNKTTSIEHLK